MFNTDIPLALIFEEIIDFEPKRDERDKAADEKKEPKRVKPTS